MKRSLPTTLAMLLCLGTAGAVPSTAAAQPSGNAKWLKAGCFETANGYRSIGTIRSYVNWIPSSDGNRKSVYYQEVKVQIDRLTVSNTWREVAHKTYDWTRFSRRAAFPMYSTSAVKTGLQPDYATLSAKATIWLKRVRKGPDKTVWKYKARSPSFTCIDPVVLGA